MFRRPEFTELTHLSAPFQDLESSTRGRSRWPSQGSRRGLLAAAGVGVVLVVLVISAAVLVNRDSSSDEEAKQRLVSGKSVKDDSFKNITLPDVLSGTYSAKGFNGSWIPGKFFTFQAYNCYQFDYRGADNMLHL